MNRGIKRIFLTLSFRIKNIIGLFYRNFSDYDVKAKDTTPVRFSHLSSYQIHLSEQTEYSSSAGHQNSLPSTFFTELKQKNPQFVLKYKRPQRDRVRLIKINLPDFRLYYKDTVIKTIWYWHKDKNID